MKDEIAERERLEQLYQTNEAVPNQGTTIKIIYSKEVSPGLVKRDQDEKQQIENLLNFIQVSNLTDNYKVLDIFRRVLGSYIAQHKEYKFSSRTKKLEEFSYQIKDDDFYHYMMFSNSPVPLSDSNWQWYLQNEFSEKLAKYDLYASK